MPFKPNVATATNMTPTSPLPGPEMVTLLPPRIETKTPPTTAAITPAIGGASLAIARPSPNGSAIRLTTKPLKIFLGNALKNPLMSVFFFVILL